MQAVDGEVGGEITLTRDSLEQLNNNSATHYHWVQQQDNHTEDNSWTDGGMSNLTLSVDDGWTNASLSEAGESVRNGLHFSLFTFH